MDEPSAPVRMRSRGRQSMRRPRTRMTHYVGNQGLVSPLRDPVLMLRRRTLVNGLFTYVEEIQNLDSGYALRFRRSHDQDDLEALIGIIADYIIFESQNAPELTFEIVEESHDKSFGYRCGACALNVQMPHRPLSAPIPPCLLWHRIQHGEAALSRLSTIDYCESPLQGLATLIDRRSQRSEPRRTAALPIHESHMIDLIPTAKTSHREESCPTVTNDFQYVHARTACTLQSFFLHREWNFHVSRAYPFS
jgi:hypothetical protein